MYTIEQLRARYMPFSSLEYSTEAFVDFCLEECKPKYNYALIGPGVSQSKSQPVSLREPHGFQVGGVRIPHGKINPPHLHFTCEVFICTRGEWEIRWGFDPDFKTAVIRTGDLVSVPTWIFRGFRNVGEDDGFLFTALGGDDTGGIIWAPEVLEAARQNGVLLTNQYRLVDTTKGDTLQPYEQPLDALSEGERSRLAKWSEADMERRIVRFSALKWSNRSLLDSTLDGCGGALAPAIGYGICEDSQSEPPITNPHGVSIEWLSLPPGGCVSKHRLIEKQVILVVSGHLVLEIEAIDGMAMFDLAGNQNGWDCYSVPSGAWRTLKNPGALPLQLLLMTAGDQRKRIDWEPGVIHRARSMDLALDASGYVAPLSVLRKAQA